MRVDRRFERVDFVTTAPEARGALSFPRIVTVTRRTSSRCDSANGRRSLAMRSGQSRHQGSDHARRVGRDRQGKRNVQHPIDHPTRRERHAARCRRRRRPGAGRVDRRRLVLEHRPRRRVRHQLRHLHDHRRQRIDRDAAGAARVLARHVLVRGRAELLQLHADAVVRRRPRRHRARRNAAAAHPLCLVLVGPQRLPHLLAGRRR